MLNLLARENRTTTRLSFITLLTVILSHFSPIAQAELPFLQALSSYKPQFAGEEKAVVGGVAVATLRSDLPQHLVADDTLVTFVHQSADETEQWAWIRNIVAGNKFNTDEYPIELAWHPVEPGQNISPILRKLRSNWGRTLIWRPAPVDAKMSYIVWNDMDVFKMKAPQKNITITNVPDSDFGHRATLANQRAPVSHHRMWSFPEPPETALEIGEENSPYKVTFTDASFDAGNPWLWTKGARWGVHHGGCRNPGYEPGTADPEHESHYPNIRWFSQSGLIEIMVPGRGNPSEYPSDGIPVAIHSDFRHIWGNAIYIRSEPSGLEFVNGKRNPLYDKNRGGTLALNVEISGEFYDAGIEFVPHDIYHPVRDLHLKNPVISDPYSLGTAYPGYGAPKSHMDATCSSIAFPRLDIGLYGTARGEVTFQYGAAGMASYLVRDLHGTLPHQPLKINYVDIGYTAGESPKYTWDARQCCIPKIDGFAPSTKYGAKQGAIRIETNVTGDFKAGRLHIPLALEWGADDSGGVDIARAMHWRTNNAIPHFVPAPPLIPPDYYPKTNDQRIFLEVSHDAIPVQGNPWLTLYSNMSLQGETELPFSLVLLGARDEAVPDHVTEDNSGQALIIEALTILDNENVFHVKPGDAPPKIRIGNSNWAPPKYLWFKELIRFENVKKNGEFIYSPAWDHFNWTLRIDKPLQPGVRFLLGKAQSYIGKSIENSGWHRNQLAQMSTRSAPGEAYYSAVKDNIPPNSNVLDPALWNKVKNPFDSMRLIYLGKTYHLGPYGAFIDEKQQLVMFEKPDR